MTRERERLTRQAVAPELERLDEDVAGKTTGASVARGSVWNYATNAIPQFYLVAVSVAAARFLGPDNFGLQSFIAFAEITLVTFLTGGLAFAEPRFIGVSRGERRPAGVRAVVHLGWQIAVPAAALGGATLLIAALAGAAPGAAWALAGVAAAAGILMRRAQGVVYGFQRWREIAILSLVIGALAAAATIAVLAAGRGITGMFAVEAASSIAGLVWMSVLANRALRSLSGSTDEEERPPIRPMLRYVAVATGGVVLTLVIWRRSEFLFLAHYSSDAQIGFYSIAFAAATALTLAPNAIAGALLPAIATLHGAGAIDRIRTGYGRALRLIITLALPLAAGAAVLGPELIKLVYGNEFGDVGTVLLVLLVPFPLVALTGVSTSVVEAMGHLRVPFVAGLAAAAINIGLDFLLIPRYDALGAGIANSVAQLVAGLPVLVFANRFVEGVQWRSALIVHTALATAAGALAALAFLGALGGLPGVIAGAAAGVVVFLLVGRAVGLLGADDGAWLDQAVGSLLGGSMGGAIRFVTRAPAAGTSP